MSQPITAKSESQLTAPNRTVEAADGVRYAYRRFGEPSTAAPPLVLLQHLRGNLDNWDSARGSPPRSTASSAERRP